MPALFVIDVVITLILGASGEAPTGAAMITLRGQVFTLRIPSRRLIRVVLVALGVTSIVCTSQPFMAASVAARRALASAQGTRSIAEAEVPMTITVVPRSESSVFRDTVLVYLDGKIDADAPNRLSTALNGIAGKITVWLNSPGGNLFAGMELGRIIRKHRAWTRIIDHRTLLPGECYSACAMAFLGGIYRFNDNAPRYGVHLASLSVRSPTGALDLGQHLSAAVGNYIGEMGVDVRLLDLWMKAGPDEMYVLTPQEAKDLRVANNGREPPQWSIVTAPRGSVLQGQQATIDGRGTVSFSCDEKQTVLGSVYVVAGKGESVAAGGWSHLLTIDSDKERPLKELSVSREDDLMGWRFLLSPDVVRLAMSAKQIGHRMKRSGNRSISLGYSVDIDGRSASMVKKFLGNCLRRQAKSLFRS